MNAVMTNKKHIVMSDGFEVVANISEYNDMELLEDLLDLEDPDPVTSIKAGIKVFRKILSPEEKARLWDHLRNDAGVVTTERVGEALQEIFEKMQGDDVENKKKLSPLQE